MRVVTYEVERSGPGRLAISARPRGGDWLGEELVALREAGVDTIVSMLTPAEAYELELDEEAQQARSAGLEFLALPTPDRAVPGSSAFRDLLGQILRRLRDEQSVVVHCRMGIGRSSLVVVGVLRAEGLGATEAWSAVASARGLPVPDTPEQRRWLDHLDWDGAWSRDRR